jgi:hypothetical protein
VKQLIRDGIRESLNDLAATKNRRGQREAIADEDESEPSYDDEATIEERITTRTGVTLMSGGVRSAAEIAVTKVQLSRFARGELVDGSSTKDKISERWCASLKEKFEVPNWSKMMTSDSSDDIASMTTGTQNVLREFRAWCAKCDVLDIFKIPLGSGDASDMDAVINGDVFTDLLTNYQKVSQESVISHQVFINTCCDRVEVESSNWACTKLENSTDKALLLRIKQEYDNLSVEQQGGITLFKLIVDEVDKDTFEGRQGLIKWVQEFDIRRFDGQDVRLATTTFKAVIKLLGNDAPTGFIRMYLKGMKHASNEEFQGVCTSQLGFLDSVMYQDWAKNRSSKLVQLDSFASTLLTSYTSLELSLEWTGAKHKASAFKASISPSTETSANTVESTNATTSANAPKKSFKEWWDSCVCEKKGCGGKHPTRYHNDLEARDRPRPPYNPRQARPNSQNRRNQREPWTTGPT